MIPKVGVRWLQGDDTQDFVAGLEFALPLFDRKGGSLHAAQREREAVVKEAENTRLRLTAALDVALQELDEAHGRLEDFSSEALPRAREALELARAGVKRLAVICPAFVADCLETLEEIGMRAAEDFVAAGGDELRLVPSLNSSDHWVDALAEILGDTRP